jgi:hypothetical protein
MGTGQKTIQKINKNLEKEVSLSIQVSLNGLSFLILENNSIRDLINYSFEKTNTPKQVLDQLMHFFNTNEN